MSFMSCMTTSFFGAHSMPSCFWSAEPTTPKSWVEGTKPTSVPLSMPMTFAPASAAARTAGFPAVPVPMTSTSQSYSSLTLCGTGGFSRKLGFAVITS